MTTKLDLTETVSLLGPNAGSAYLDETNEMLYFLDPEDGTDEIIVLCGRIQDRMPRGQLLELLEAR